MSWLLDLDSDTYSPLTDKTLVVILAYLGIALLLCLLAMTLHNAIQYMVRQGRWTVMPLFFFYLVAIGFLGFRICCLLFVLEIRYVFMIFFPGVLKLVIGYTQVWTIIELTFRVKQCTYALKNISNENTT